MIDVDEKELWDIRVDADGWAAIDAEALVAACYRAVLAPEANGAVSVLFTDDAAMQKLNASFRGKDKPTNVLSFPQDDVGKTAFGAIGDIALGLQTCNREAAARGVELRCHAAHLLVHGMLHLIGYDHQTDKEAAVMEGRETEILAALGVPDPYGFEK